MGRLTQAFHFLTVYPLPAQMERDGMYTHIGNEFALKSLRKELSLYRNVTKDDSKK